MIVAHATGGPTRNPVSTENGQKSVLLRNVNRINQNQFQLKRFSLKYNDLRQRIQLDLYLATDLHFASGVRHNKKLKNTRGIIGLSYNIFQYLFSL